MWDFVFFLIFDKKIVFWPQMSLTLARAEFFDTHLTRRIEWDGPELGISLQNSKMAYFEFEFSSKIIFFKTFDPISPQKVIYGPHGLYFLVKSPYMDRTDHIFLVESPYMDPSAPTAPRAAGQMNVVDKLRPSADLGRGLGLPKGQRGYSPFLNIKPGQADRSDGSSPSFPMFTKRT